MPPRRHSVEKYEYHEAATLAEDRLAWLDRINGMSEEERAEHYYNEMGWSLEIPYSRELYKNPTDVRLRRRLRATESLRLILGYAKTLQAGKYWESQLRFRLRKSNMKDVRLICVDTDKVRRLPEILPGDWRRRITSFHLGVAIVDTRDIRDVVQAGIQLPNPSDLIHTYQFAVQGSGPKKDEFLFGKTEAISAEDLRAKFNEWQAGRDVAVIAYSARNDLLTLRDFGILTGDICRIDMAQAAYIPFQSASAQKLEVVMQRLNMQYDKLHVPGNDAHFTMRTFFGLAALDLIREYEYRGYGPEKIPPWYDLAVKIARSPLPRKGDRRAASTSASGTHGDSKDG
ncbi:3-5 exonuclease superfamily protein [Fusarium austroafricanum]|uniref:3-5 exonuclease superfamily protein n=1 Tax=Fusarium austroafricanum TaxID=2364996 RepID=A0A8H4KWT2_9HYPO|nr:3-5 exonuclease superfamily protein [Fusarium austroafricanum]